MPLVSIIQIINRVTPYAHRIRTVHDENFYYIYFNSLIVLRKNLYFFIVPNRTKKHFQLQFSQQFYDFICDQK